MLNVTLRGYHQQLGIPSDYERTTRLPFQHVPDELVYIGLDIYERSQQLQPIAATAWAAMRESAAENSIELLVVSAFRSPEYQVEVIQRQLSKGRTIEDILKHVAAPGFSEHHSGCAVDLTTSGFEAVADEFEESPAFVWLTRKAAGFGFVLSYPRHNGLGVVYEPWHWCFKGSVT